MKMNYWLESGLAAQSAKSLAWFVVLIVVLIGVCLWRDMAKEEKERKSDAQKQTKQG